MFRKIFAALLVSVLLIPTASAYHLPNLQESACHDPNLVVDVVRGVVCVVWNDGLAPAYHIAATLATTVRDAVLAACEQINGSPCV